MAVHRKVAMSMENNGGIGTHLEVIWKLEVDVRRVSQVTQHCAIGNWLSVKKLLFLFVEEIGEENLIPIDYRW